MAHRQSWSDSAARRRWPMDAGSLLAAARRQTGLRALGDPPPGEALAALAQSLETEAGLHPLGRFLMWTHLVNLLATRMRLVARWQRARDTRPVAAPLFITGMPRSGSTFLHALLAADPRNRTPRTWEVMFPVPPDGFLDMRAARADAELWLFRRLAPAADAVHPLRAGSPQECEAIHSYVFRSHEFLSTCWLPSYEAYLKTCDFGPAYAFQLRFLQHLQAGAPARRWVLKSPDHAHSLPALLSVFPDAVIVQTHRPPAEVLRSSLRLVEVLHRVFAHPAGREERARREARVLVDCVEALSRFRQTHADLAARFVDVRYAELVADPLATVGRIYRHWGRPLSAAAAASMQALAARRMRYPKPRVRAAEHLAAGLEAELRRLAPYCARFGLPPPP